MKLRSRPRSVLAIGVTSIAFLCATLHCGSSEEPHAAADDHGSAGVVDGGSAPAVSFDDSASPTVGHPEAGTIDSGRDNAAVTVCAGSKGDPGAVPILDWQIAAFAPKYKVSVGAKSILTEPTLWIDHNPVVNGTFVEDTTQTSHSTLGAGPFKSVGAIGADEFAEYAMPETDAAFAFEKRLGWSDLLKLYYRGATDLAKVGWDEFRVAGRAVHFMWRSWSLTQVSRKPPSPLVSDGDYYVKRITAEHGMGWLFSVVFDHPCKTAAFDALIGKNALSILDPKPPYTRAEISQFLVDNNARLFLRVVTFGTSAPGIRAALVGTQASAATLGDLETTMTALTAALDAYVQNVGTPDYASVTDGTNPSWVIGSVYSLPLSDLP